MHMHALGRERLFLRRARALLRLYHTEMHYRLLAIQALKSSEVRWRFTYADRYLRIAALCNKKAKALRKQM